MNSVELKDRISNLSIWKKNGQRAPHKPLLILYALGQLTNNKKFSLPYEEVREELKSLLIEFGPARKSYHPEEPFVRLERDGIWEIDAISDMPSPNDKKLLQAGVTGGFINEVLALLQSDKTLTYELASQILEEHFPDTMHEDILERVGLNAILFKKKPRDPRFRDKVLRAYEYSCAVCGFNVRLGSNLVAIEAAHIKWHQVGGPDVEENGIALCSLHHKLFDRGVFSLSKNLELLVAEEAHGTRGFEDWLMRYHGQQLRKPIRPEYEPQVIFTDWHIKEVFRGPARYIV
ncbi:HNH endonuclease [Paenibacillus sp. TRM 82003]|nr:HNH endonuclease [Paenibacillus sp. TRM 82003]